MLTNKHDLKGKKDSQKWREKGLKMNGNKTHLVKGPVGWGVGTMFN